MKTELLSAVMIAGFLLGLIAVAVCAGPVIVWHLSRIGKHSAKRGSRDVAANHATMEQEKINDLWWRRGYESPGLRGG